MLLNVPTGIPAAAFALSGNDDNINEAIAPDFVRRLSDTVLGNFDKPSFCFLGNIDFLTDCGFNCFKDEA